MLARAERICAEEEDCGVERVVPAVVTGVFINPAFLINQNGHYVGSNEQGQKLLGTLLYVTREGVLRFCDTSLDKKLRGLRRWFFEESSEHNVRWLLDPTLAIRLRRCPDAQGEPMMDHTIMTVRETKDGWHVTPDIVRRTFSLTPMQARLVHALVSGKNLDEFAEGAGITKHTAKHHLSAVMPKFDVNTQTELVRRVCIFLSG